MIFVSPSVQPQLFPWFCFRRHICQTDCLSWVFSGLSKEGGLSYNLSNAACNVGSDYTWGRQGFFDLCTLDNKQKTHYQNHKVARNQLFRLFQHEKPLGYQLLILSIQYWQSRASEPENRSGICGFPAPSSPQLLWNNNSQTFKCSARLTLLANQKPEWDRQNKMQCGLGLVEKEAEKYQSVHLHFHRLALLMILPFFIKSHHVESTCLGNVLTQEFALAPYERHSFNEQILLYHSLWLQDEETIKWDQIEGDQTGSLSKTSHRGIQGQMHARRLYRARVMKQKRQDATKECQRKRNQTTESLSLHPVGIGRVCSTDDDSAPARSQVKSQLMSGRDPRRNWDAD